MASAPIFSGCGTALVTPFRQDLSLDEQALRRLVRRQVDAGINFLVPCGTTGENPTLSHEEHLRVGDITIEEAVSIPIVLYNVPGRTSVNLEPATVRRLAHIENIVGVKEASGNIAQIGAICAQVPERFTVLSGDDVVTLPAIALGGRGVISVVANETPAEMTQLVRLCLEGQFETARALQKKYLPLMEVNFAESNPIPVKAALAAIGLIEPVWRLPLCPPHPETRDKILGVLELLGLAGGRHVARVN